MSNKIISLLVVLLSLCYQTDASALSNDRPRKISVIGTGYVGLVLGAGLAEWGYEVICADIAQEKIALLQNGIIPFYEPGLDRWVSSNLAAERLSFTSDIIYAIQAADIIFIAVGTPSNDDGSANISAVEAVAREIGKNLNSSKIICLKSTVPIGTTSKIEKIIKAHITPENDYQCDITFNPEFLREGSALADFINTDRLVIGGTNPVAVEAIKAVFSPLFENDTPFIATNLQSAETIKYASNAFLATKISFINEFANLCDVTGADVAVVARGMGLDKRIGSSFLSPGPGYGGSCFPKDTLGLLHQSKELGVDLKVVEATVAANDFQMNRVVLKTQNLLGNLQGKNIAILGLAFKANTNDIRSAPAITIIGQLLTEGALVNAYDPMAMDNMRKVLPGINYCDSIDQAVTDVDAVIVLTEWEEIKNVDLNWLYQKMPNPTLIDARNLYNPADLLRIGFNFTNMGRPVQN